jgi:hypothetical protein
MKKFRYLISFLILNFSFCLAQTTATIRGFVYEKASGEPIPFTNVYLKGTTIGASTDINGFFTLSKIKPGDYVLLVTSLEYDTIREPIALKAGDLLNKKFYAKKGGINLTEVDVSTEATDKIENTQVSVQKIDPIVINKLPSIGEPDLAQYLQVLPGVTFTGDQGGQLYIRGGLPVQNKVLLDGLTIYNPFHSIGLFSVFDNDIMKNADVYSAGFGAEYGGRTSSVMDITTRDGNKKRLAGKVSASTFGAKLTLEGPLKKLTDDGNTSMSYLFSGKHSYLPTTSKSLYRYANPNGLPFYYTDLYGKLSLNSTGGSKLSAFGFNFNDKVDYSQLASFKWNAKGAGVNFILIPPSSSILIEGIVAASNYKIDFQNPLLTTDSKGSKISGFNAGFNFVKFIGRQELKFGFEGVITSSTFSLSNQYGSQITLERSTTDIGAFAKYKYLGERKRLILEPSFRLQYYATLAVFSPEPRLAMKWNITPKIRFKGAGGLYSQTLLSANSDRDVVNLFYGFVNSPEKSEISKEYLDANGKVQQTNSSVQKAWHSVGGFELDLFKHFELNVEVYQKFFNQIINVNRDKVYTDNAINENKPDVLKKDFVVEQGRARGFDVVLKYDRKRFYFWAVYSYGLNDRWVGNNTTKKVYQYPPNFDRRHNINLVSSYTFGKKKNWEFNARWNLGTGFPFTKTQGYIAEYNPSGDINFDFNTANGLVNYVPAELNQGRLPDFHRLDLGVKYRYNWTERNTLEISAGATNVYNRENIFYVNRFTFDRINQLPILPNFNMSLSF